MKSTFGEAFVAARNAPKSCAIQTKVERICRISFHVTPSLEKPKCGGPWAKIAFKVLRINLKFGHIKVLPI